MKARYIFGFYLSTVFALLSCASAPDVKPVDAMPVSVRNIAVPSTDLFDSIAAMDAAKTAFENGDYAQALAGFRTALSADKDNEAVLLGFGNSALALGKGDVALQVFQRLKSETPAALSGLILAEIMTGQSADIELRLNEALERDQSDPRLWNALGRYFDDQNRPLLAQDNYIKAIATGRASAGAINNLGMSYLMAGRSKDALVKFEHALSMDESNLLYDNNRRLVLALSRNYAQAVENLPDYHAADILNDAGYIAKMQGNLAAARRLFEAAIAASPRHHSVAYENLSSLNTP